MAGMWWKVPGGLLGIMAGGEAVAPEEAEAGPIRGSEALCCGR